MLAALLTGPLRSPRDRTQSDAGMIRCPRPLLPRRRRPGCRSCPICRARSARPCSRSLPKLSQPAGARSKQAVHTRTIALLMVPILFSLDLSRSIQGYYYCTKICSSARVMSLFIWRKWRPQFDEVLVLKWKMDHMGIGCSTPRTAVAKKDIEFKTEGANVQNLQKANVKDETDVADLSRLKCQPVMDDGPNTSGGLSLEAHLESQSNNSDEPLDWKKVVLDSVSTISSNLSAVLGKNWLEGGLISKILSSCSEEISTLFQSEASFSTNQVVSGVSSTTIKHFLVCIGLLQSRMYSLQGRFQELQKRMSRVQKTNIRLSMEVDRLNMEIEAMHRRKSLKRC